MSTIRLLVANGCSYTRGAELDDPEREAWPARLAARLGVPFVNLGCDGGSNRRIVRTTVENLYAVAAAHGTALAHVLVVCMWTGITRGECHRTNRPDAGNRPGLPTENEWHRLGRWRIEEHDPLSEAYFRYLWDEPGAAVNFFLDWVLLDSFLRGQGVTARYAYAWETLPARLPDQTRITLSQLDPARIFGNSLVSHGTSFYATVNDRFPTGRIYHPLASAHDYFGGLLAKWLCDDQINSVLPEGGAIDD